MSSKTNGTELICVQLNDQRENVLRNICAIPLPQFRYTQKILHKRLIHPMFHPEPFTPNEAGSFFFQPHPQHPQSFPWDAITKDGIAIMDHHHSEANIRISKAPEVLRAGDARYEETLPGELPYDRSL